MENKTPSRVSLINGDAFKCLRDMESASVDAIITDPPYNISRDNNFASMGRAGINFGGWDYAFDLTGWLKDAYRVLRRGGALIVFNAWKNLGLISQGAEDAGLVTKDAIRWVKANPMPRNRDRRYITDYEMGVWFVKPGAKWTFNRHNGTYDIPEFRCAAPSKSERLGHPTQKPVALMQWLVETHTNPGDTVLDPFMGVGTTGEACLGLGRNFVGVELDSNYYEVAKERLKCGK